MDIDAAATVDSVEPADVEKAASETMPAEANTNHKDRRLKNQNNNQQQQQQQQQRRPALKGEDAWKRMNFLYQSSHHLSLLPHATLGSNLARFYLLNMRKIASKLVLRLDPCVKNTMCKRCGSLLLPGQTARTIVVNEGTPDIQMIEADQTAATMTAEEAEIMREWRQDQVAARAGKRAAKLSVPMVSNDAAINSVSLVSPPPPPATSSPSDRSTSKQRRLQRRAEASLAKLGATGTAEATGSSSVPSIPAHAVQAAVAAVAQPIIAVVAPTTISTTVSSIASPSLFAIPVAAAAAADASLSSMAPVPRARRRLRRKSRSKHSLTSVAPHVLTVCTLCNTSKRIHTKPSKQKAGVGE